VPRKLLARDDWELLGPRLEPFLAVKTQSARRAAFPAARPSLANLNAEKPCKLAKPVENPILPVATIPPPVRVGTAEERSSNAASDAVVVNANTVFIDDVAARAGMGRSRCEQVRHTKIVFV
jgi:hypothetical protein